MASPRRHGPTSGIFLLALAGAALPAIGCSASPRNFGTGGASASSGPGMGGAGGQGSASTSASGSGSGGGLPAVCTPGMPRWAGPLCGPQSLPCKVITDETLPDKPSSRIGPPSIALDQACSPQILFDNNLGKFNGFYAVRAGANGWTVEATPYEITSSGFAVLDDGTPLVIGNDAKVWQKPKGGIWSSAVPFDPANLSNADGFARDPGGGLHLALYNFKDTNAYYGNLAAGTNAWTLTQVGAMVSTTFPLALSFTGDPHLTYWSSTGGNGWTLYWVTPPGKAEVATPLGSNTLDVEAQQQKLAVTAADVANPSGRPHVLFVRSVAGNTQYHEIVTVERNQPGAWVTTSLDQEKSTGKFCAGTVAIGGAMCSFDYEQLTTLGMVASKGGDLRFVYAKIHHTGTSISICDPKFQICFWQTQVDTSTGEIRVAWLDQNGKPASAAVADKVIPSSGRVIVDTIGHLHLAVLDLAMNVLNGNTVVRYLEIGP